MEYMEQAMQQQIDGGISEAERCYDEIAQLKAERDELTAQVEYLKSHFNELIEIAQRCDSWESFPQKPLDRALAALQSLPQQCLRDVQADAVKRFVEFNAGRYTNHFDFCLSDALETYLAWSQT